MSRIVRRRAEASYRTRKGPLRVVDLTRSTTLSPEQLAEYAEDDRYNEMVELSELAAGADVLRDQLHDRPIGWIFNGGKRAS